MSQTIAEWNRDDLSLKWDGWEVVLEAMLEDTGICLTAEEALWLLDFLRDHETVIRSVAESERQG